jgi:hypothetical protein
MGEHAQEGLIVGADRVIFVNEVVSDELFPEELKDVFMRLVTHGIWCVDQS